jgi:hypothetical protein
VVRVIDLRDPVTVVPFGSLTRRFGMVAPIRDSYGYKYERSHGGMAALGVLVLDVHSQSERSTHTDRWHLR